MRVRVERDADCCVTEPLAHDFRVHVRTEQERRVRVPELVKRERPDARLARQPLERTGHVLRVDGPAVCLSEDQAVILIRGAEQQALSRLVRAMAMEVARAEFEAGRVLAPLRESLLAFVRSLAPVTA